MVRFDNNIHNRLRFPWQLGAQAMWSVSLTAGGAPIFGRIAIVETLVGGASTSEKEVDAPQSGVILRVTLRTT